MPSTNPNIGREFPNAGIQHVADNAIFETYDHGTFMISQAVIAAVGKGTSEAARRVAAFAQGLEKLSQSSKSQLADVHNNVAQKMQAATVAAYKAHPKRSTPLYRASQRDAGGRLLAALDNPLMCRGTYDGIGFVNTTLLDKEARQWHRLNFGAQGPSGGGAITTAHRARWDGMVIGAFGFTDESSSRAFRLPRGLWLNAAGTEREAAGASRTGQFIPQGGQGGKGDRNYLSGKGIMGRPNESRLTKGIRAWNFLDAGVKVLARELGPAYDDLYAGWHASAARGVGPLRAIENIPLPRSTPRQRR